MTILSDTDIKKELGKNILIYPFKKTQLKGASYNLTASTLAWSLTTKQSIYIDGKIIIEPGTTALIETNEVIWVSQKIAGTYHSKVGMVSQGTGHVGTTLDPNYIGRSLIAIHNHYYPFNNNGIEEINPIILQPEDEEDAIATLVFHYVMSEATRKGHGNHSGRIEIITKDKIGINVKESERRDLSQDYMINPETLKLKMEKDCEDYKQIEKERQSEADEIEKKRKQEADEIEKQRQQERQRETEEMERKIKQEAEDIESNRQMEADKFFKQWYIIFSVSIAILLIASAFLTVNSKILANQAWYAYILTIIDKTTTALFGALIALGISDIQRKSKRLEK